MPLCLTIKVQAADADSKARLKLNNVWHVLKTFISVYKSRCTLGEDTNIIKKDVKVLFKGSRETGLEVNIEKTILCLATKMQDKIII
jgi:hypothetical protein